MKLNADALRRGDYRRRRTRCDVKIAITNSDGNEGRAELRRRAVRESDLACETEEKK